MRVAPSFLAVLAMMVSGLGACSESAQVTDPRIEPSFDGVDETPLTISLTGNEYITSGGMQTVTASVSGGSAPYYYTWYKRYCSNDPAPGDDCPSSYVLFRQGQGESAASLYTYSFDIRNDVVLEVRETVDGPITGKAKFTINGPLDPDINIPGSLQFKCSLGSMGWAYPFEEWDWVDGNLVKTGETYRRNPCTGAKEFRQQ